MIYKEYARRRPQGYLRPETRFYLQPVRKLEGSEKWFTREPIGKNSISSFARNIEEQANVMLGRKINCDTQQATSDMYEIVETSVVSETAMPFKHLPLECTLKIKQEDVNTAASDSIKTAYGGLLCSAVISDNVSVLHTVALKSKEVESTSKFSVSSYVVNENDTELVYFSAKDSASNNGKKFVNCNEEDTYTMTEKEINANTQRQTVSHIRMLTKWLESKNEFRKPEELSPAELDNYLASFFVSVRKEVQKENTGNLQTVGEQYEPHTLAAIHSSVQRYLAAKGYKGNIKTDKQFVHSRNALAAKRNELKQLGKGKRARASLPFTEDELERFWSLHLLGTSKI